MVDCGTLVQGQLGLLLFYLRYVNLLVALERSAPPTSIGLLNDHMDASSIVIANLSFLNHPGRLLHGDGMLKLGSHDGQTRNYDFEPDSSYGDIYFLLGAGGDKGDVELHLLECLRPNILCGLAPVAVWAGEEQLTWVHNL